MGPGRRIVGCPEGLARRFILLAVVHAAGSKGLPSPDIVATESLPTPAAAEDDECSEGNEPETHDTSNGEADNKTFVLTIFTRVEVTLHAVVFGGFETAFIGGGGGWIGAGSRLGWVCLLFSGLTGTVEATSFHAFCDGEGNVIRGLRNEGIR